MVTKKQSYKKLFSSSVITSCFPHCRMQYLSGNVSKVISFFIFIFYFSIFFSDVTATDFAADTEIIRHLSRQHQQLTIADGVMAQSLEIFFEVSNRGASRITFRIIKLQFVSTKLQVVLFFCRPQLGQSVSEVANRPPHGCHRCA